MMNPKDLKKLLSQVERLVLTQPRTGGDTKFQLSILFHDAVECIDYRIPMKPVLLNKNGHEFKCPRCGTIFDSPESHVTEYDLCYVCGQLWKDHDTTMEELYGKNFGNNDGNESKTESKHEYKTESKHEYKTESKHEYKTESKHEYKTESKHEYGRKKKGKKR